MPPVARKADLLIMAPGRAALTHTLRLGDAVFLGSAAPARLRIEGLSKFVLLRIALGDAGLELSDHKSELPVQVNGKTVKSQLLAAGDRVQVGDATILFELTRASGSQPRATEACSRCGHQLGQGPRLVNPSARARADELVCDLCLLYKRWDEDAIKGFEPELLLAQGPHGSLYKARDRAGRREVALRVMSRERCRDLDALFEQLSKVEKVLHPNIAGLADFGVEGERIYAAEEFIAGHSLELVVRTHGPVLAELSCTIACALLSGLQSLKRQGLQHGRLEPRNIIVTPQGQAVLVELARFEAFVDWGRVPALVRPRSASFARSFMPSSAGADHDLRDAFASVAFAFCAARANPSGEFENLRDSLRRWRSVQEIPKQATPELGRRLHDALHHRLFPGHEDAELDIAIDAPWFLSEVASGSGNAICARCLKSFLAPGTLRRIVDRSNAVTDLLCSHCRAFANMKALGRLGGYLPVDRLGEGTSAIVYRGVGPDGEQVALKVFREHRQNLDAAALARLGRAAKAAASIYHPNVVKIIAFGEEAGRNYEILELVEGPNLEELVRSRGRLDPGALVLLADALLGGLSAAFAAGVVHRDIKPENVLLSSTGAPKISDFSVARFFNVDMPTGLSPPNTVRGTPLYMPLEQLHDSSRADHRCDLYALGATLFFGLTGENLYNDVESVHSLLEALRSQTPSPAIARRPEISPILSEFLEQLTAKNPEDRYQKAEDALFDLREMRRLCFRELGLLPCETFDREADQREILRRIYG